MKMLTILAFVSFFGVCAFAQQAANPQLKLRIVVDKDSYTLREKVVVKAELTNLTSKTLCFPVPDQDCSTPQTGWVVTTGQALRTGESEQFICHVDARGPVGAELDSDIKTRWIKLPPNAVYVTSATEAKVTLSEVGAWRLTASYHPPEGSFSAKYKKVLQSAAQEARCQLPDSMVTAEPRLISVRSAGAKDR